ncbi:MAG: exonuclease [Oscillospiraceae bacterium]|nr:exonuclease [Oscillospiraceae bacterium]
MPGIVIDGNGKTCASNEMKSARERKGKSLLELVSDYVVLDLETTGLDTHFDRIIELGAIRYRGDAEVTRFQSFVNPGGEIPEFITELTGITNDMLKDAPPIEKILPVFLDFVGDDLIIGHNVHFDVNFLYDNALEILKRPVSNDFVDTLRMSRRVYRDLPNHKLATVCEHLHVPQPEAHRAIADCIRTQACYVSMKEAVSSGSVSLAPSWDNYNGMAKTIQAETDSFDPEHPLFGKYVAFTGALQCMTRKEAMQHVANVGGICCDGVKKETNFLVLGNNDYCASIKDGKSAKQKKAEKMQLGGFDIRTISENVFYEMLGDPDILRVMHQHALREAALKNLQG